MCRVGHTRPAKLVWVKEPLRKPGVPDYKRLMAQQLIWVPTPRFEPEFQGRWGLRSGDGRWVAVVYASEAEAKTAASAMTITQPKTRSDNDNAAARFSFVS